MSTHEEASSTQLGRNEPPAVPELLKQIRQIIKSANRAVIIRFKDVGLETGSFIARSLDGEAERDGRTYRVAYNSFELVLEMNILKGAIHYFHSSWLNRQLAKMATHSDFITEDELSLIGSYNGSAFTNFSAPYTFSVRAPDQCIMQRGKDMPNVVFESTWEADRERLLQDVDMWLRGSLGTVQLVILFEWTDLPNRRVNADIKVYNLDKEGNVNLLQSEALFPAPLKPRPTETGATKDTPESQVIRVTRGQLFGSALLAGRNPDDVFGFSIDDIRDTARGALNVEGRIPA